MTDDGMKASEILAKAGGLELVQRWICWLIDHDWDDWHEYALNIGRERWRGCKRCYCAETVQLPAQRMAEEAGE